MNFTGKISLPPYLYVVISMAAALFMCTGAAKSEKSAAPGKRAEILVLNSYHRGFEWSESTLAGLTEELDESGFEYELFVENLDTKRFPSPRLPSTLVPYLKNKYAGRGFAAVLISDDNALRFFISYRDSIAPGVPGVFCGVNASPESLPKNISGLTGVFEAVDLRSTIEVALDLHPETREIVVVDDMTSTNLALRDRLKTLIPNFENRVRIRFLEAKSTDQVLHEAEQLGANSLILLLAFSHDEQGEFLEYKESISLLRAATTVPIYSCWDFYLGFGVVGGMMTNGHMQGISAGVVARRILAGEDVDSIPFQTDSPNQFMFDDQELKRFGIDAEDLPEGSVVINVPPSFYEVNRRTIQAVSTVASIMALVILVLATNIMKRRRAEAELIAERGRLRRALSQESLMADAADLLNSTDDFRTVLDDLLNLLMRKLDVDRISLRSLSPSSRTSRLITSKLSRRGETIREPASIDADEVAEVYALLLRGERFVNNDVSTLPEDLRSHYSSRNIRSLVLLPVKVAGIVKGVLALAMVESYCWRDDELSTFNTLSDMVGNSWERHDQTTARLEAEQKHTEAIQELEASSRMASLGVMAAGITHEINQPLNAIKVTTDSAIFYAGRNPGSIPERIMETLNKIAGGADRIDAIVRHMRNFRITPGSESVGSVDLNQSIRNAVTLVERQIYDHGVDSRIELSADSPLVIGHELQIEQILINLVANAIKSLESVSRTDKYIRIVTRIDDQGAWLEVHDNGVGLPDEDDYSIFDPFFSSRPVGEGSGLGLAIVKRFVTGFGGEILHGDNADGGASFRIRFRVAAGLEVG